MQKPDAYLFISKFNNNVSEKKKQKKNKKHRLNVHRFIMIIDGAIL